MKFRKLRIAWSVFWILVAVPMILLWVRSYQWTDHVLGEVALQTPTPSRTTQSSEFITQQGQLVIGDPSSLGAILKFKWEHERMDEGGFLGRSPSWLPRYYIKPEELTIPLWMTVVFPCALALLSWVPGRFSLRTLLIATTLVAVVLGLIVWAAKS